MQVLNYLPNSFLRNGARPKRLVPSNKSEDGSGVAVNGVADPLVNEMLKKGRGVPLHWEEKGLQFRTEVSPELLVGSIGLR